MSNRHYLCPRCGGMKRTAAMHVPKDDVFPDTWPRCCGRSMQLLDYEYAAAAVKITPEERLLWSRLGQHIYRGRRWGIWKAALNDHEIERAKQDRAAYSKSINPPKRYVWKRRRKTTKKS